MQQVPVIIISGFLGSGKTTLLLRLLKDAQTKELRAAVLMNELGRADVDGSLIQAGSSGLALEKMVDGCICCDKKGEIAQCLLQLLQTQPDVIFIELTGVANPEEIAESLAEPRLRHHVALKRIVTVLDSELTLEYNSIFSADKLLVNTLRRQMETADIILLNKMDLTDRHTTDKLLKVIRERNNKAVSIITSFSSIDTDLLLHDVERRTIPSAVPARPRFQVRSSMGATASKKEPASHRHHHNPSYSRLQTLCLNAGGHVILAQKQVEAFIKQIRGQLIRAKGYIQADKSSPMSLYQFAGKRGSWDKTDYSGASYLVLIGIDLDESSIRNSWEALFS